MKKNTFLTSTIILLVGGLLTKVIGLVIKVIYTRILQSDGIALYSLVMPTYSLLITLANFNIQLAISKRISSKNNSKKVIINAMYIMFILDCLLILITFLGAKFISINLLHNKSTYYPLLACSLTLPFISIGYIIKGYFYGKQNMSPHMISNVLEQLFRLVIITYLLPKLIPYGTVILVTTLILFNILSETFSILIFFFFLPTKFNLKKEDFIYNKEETKDILSISIPSITGRLIGNIGYFFEPIILTSILLYKGLSSTYITREYGAYNAYAISTLLFPSFFITAISNSLLPEISKINEERNHHLLKKRIKEAIFLSVSVGLICTSIIYIFKEPLLSILYNTKEGIDYIKTLTPFFILFYLESPLTSILIGLNKVKECSFISVSGIILKLVVMSILALTIANMNALVYSEIINIIYVTTLDIYFIKKYFKHI